MKRKTKGRIWKGTAILLDVGVPMAATLTQFPVWIERSSDATVSGLFLLFAMLSCLPFLKQIREYMKSPSVWSLWCILFVSLFALRNIIDEMLVIAFWGLLSNVIGAVVYRIGSETEKAGDKEWK